MDLWLLLSFSCHCSYILMGGCAGWSSLLLALGFPHKFVCGCSSVFVRASSQVTSGGSSLSLAEVFLSMCDVLVDFSLLVVRETSPVLVGASSVIGASGSSDVSAKDSVASL